MPLGDFIPEGTVQSRLLCEEISKRSDGICILAFSRGKDSIPAWIWLRQFFHTIYPYHLSPCPNISWIERSLKFYEEKFSTKIDRFIDGEVSECIKHKVYQTLERHSTIEAMSLSKSYFNYADVAEVMRKKYNCPQAYLASAYLMNDNIFRRMNLKKLDSEGNLTYAGGIVEFKKTFYPTFDWTLAQNLEAIVKSEVWLPDDYLIAKRTISPLLNLGTIERVMDLYPDDFETLQRLFPLIKAIWARNQFRRMKISGNGVIPRTVSEVLKEDRLERLEQELENVRNSNERKPGKRLAKR